MEDATLKFVAGSRIVHFLAEKETNKIDYRREPLCGWSLNGDNIAGTINRVWVSIPYSRTPGEGFCKNGRGPCKQPYTGHRSCPCLGGKSHLR
jgi:hypothetical protein